MAKSKEIQHHTAPRLISRLCSCGTKTVHAHTYKLESNLTESSNVSSFYRYVNKSSVVVAVLAV